MSPPNSMRDFRIRLPEGIVLDDVYRLGKELGAGGFGITYLAEDVRLGHKGGDQGVFSSPTSNRRRRSSPRSARVRAPRSNPSEGATSGIKRQSVAEGQQSAASVTSEALPTNPTRLSIWSHNNSTMRLVAEGAERRFVYESPRAGLSAVGVRKGTVLFEGRKDGDRYVGEARIFHPRCGVHTYEVAGTVSPDQERVEMTGNKPDIDSACNVAGTKPDALVFEFVELRPE
jgi:hypothetical protein